MLAMKIKIKTIKICMVSVYKTITIGFIKTLRYIKSTSNVHYVGYCT